MINSILFNKVDGNFRIILSHGIQDSGDGPILNYSNKKGLELWKMDWEQLTRMPSKFTAEPLEQSKRDAFMREV